MPIFFKERLYILKSSKRVPLCFHTSSVFLLCCRAQIRYHRKSHVHLFMMKRRSPWSIRQWITRQPTSNRHALLLYWFRKLSFTAATVHLLMRVKPRKHFFFVPRRSAQFQFPLFFSRRPLNVFFTCDRMMESVIPSPSSGNVISDPLCVIFLFSIWSWWILFHLYDDNNNVSEPGSSSRRSRRRSAQASNVSWDFPLVPPPSRADRLFSHGVETWRETEPELSKLVIPSLFLY